MTNREDQDQKHLRNINTMCEKELYNATFFFPPKDITKSNEIKLRAHHRLQNNLKRKYGNSLYMIYK